MLGLIRRVFSSSVAVPAKRSLYTSLVHSQLLYCSKIWHPYLLVDVKAIELVQRRATKFIVNDTSMDYRNRLIHLKLLPLMMELEIADIMFLIKSMRSPTDHFNIYNFVEFSSRPTRSCSNFKLKHSISRTKMEGNFYLIASHDYGTPFLHLMLIFLFQLLNTNSASISGTTSLPILTPTMSALSTISVSVKKVFVTTREHAFRQLFNLTLRVCVSQYGCTQYCNASGKVVHGLQLHRW